MKQKKHNGKNHSGAIKHLKQASGEYLQRLKMRKLVDRWGFGTFFMVSVLKLLQLLKKIGIKTEENGWRRLCGVFLRNEHSKFILASFRLKYFQSKEIPENELSAKKILIANLAEFLRNNPSSHWAFKWGVFRFKRKKIYFTDIIEARFNKKGELVELIPYFDSTRPSFSLLSEDIIQSALARIVKRYNLNEKKHVDDHKRAWRIYTKLRHWAFRACGLSFAAKHELCHLIERILDATFIQFENLGEGSGDLVAERFAIPKMRKKRHPGFGLLNVVCRFANNYAEADLWVQYHHVPVDGVPMLEMLNRLKAEWGEVGPVKYPALGGEAAKPEIIYSGNKLFRGRSYINFENFLNIRKQLNGKYCDAMGGYASVASMIIWGLSQQKYFKNRKFIVPINTELEASHPKDRHVSFVIIRPGKYYDKSKPLNGFLNFQKVYNQRLGLTKRGKSETYELLELYSIVHPMICIIAKYIFPRAMGEIFGTAGFTILKDAEMLIGPLTDLQFNGFAAIGNLKMPTEDGKTAGAFSVCSRKKEVKEYFKAMQVLTENYYRFLSTDEHR